MAHPEETKTTDPGQRVAPEFEDFQNPRKVFHHIDRVHELLTTGDTHPVHMTIGLTNYCNHKCSWCYINWAQAGRTSERSGAGDASRRAVNADEAIIEAVLEARAMGLKAVTIVGDGEPTLHPRFEDYLARIAASGVEIGIFSNFSMQRPTVLEAMARHCFFVRGSIDAARPEAHRRSHGTDDFDLVVANLRRLVELRGTAKHPVIGVQYVTNHWNYEDLPYAARFYRDLGVDYMSIKPAYKSELNPAHPENEVDMERVFAKMREAQTYATSSFKVYAKYPQFHEAVQHKYNDGRYYHRCLGTPLSAYIDQAGDVEICSNLMGHGFVFGNVTKTPFREVWASAQRKDCIDRIDLSRCPSGCKLDPLNKVLWDAYRPDPDRDHPNFL